MGKNGNNRHNPTYQPHSRPERYMAISDDCSPSELSRTIYLCKFRHGWTLYQFLRSTFRMQELLRLTHHGRMWPIHSSSYSAYVMRELQLSWHHHIELQSLQLPLNEPHLTLSHPVTPYGVWYLNKPIGIDMGDLTHLYVTHTVTTVLL